MQIVPEVNVCQSKYELYFTGALYLVQGLMLAFGVFLAWETRKVIRHNVTDVAQNLQINQWLINWHSYFFLYPAIINVSSLKV